MGLHYRGLYTLFLKCLIQNQSKFLYKPMPQLRCLLNLDCRILRVQTYMAGVRSRSAALELSTFDVFKDKSISEIKQILSGFQFQDGELSDSSKVWIELLCNSAKAQTPKKISFPTFTWKRNDLPDKLYLRETNGKCFLFSRDGYFMNR